MDNIYLISGRGNGKSLMQLKVMLDKAQGVDISSPDYWSINNWVKEINIDTFSDTNVNKEAKNDN